MADYYKATIRNGKLIFSQKATLSKTQALRILRHPGNDNVYCNRRQASSLASALSQGQGNWRDAPHLLGGYRHYHDHSRQYPGHIFYGTPKT